MVFLCVALLLSDHITLPIHLMMLRLDFSYLFLQDVFSRLLIILVVPFTLLHFFFFCWWQGGWTRWPPEGSANLHDAVIL